MATPSVFQSIRSGLLAGATTPAVDDLLRQIRGDDEEIRAKAWQYAYIAGPAALAPLAILATHDDVEIGRAAKRGMWKIVRHAGRPNADNERSLAASELRKLLGADQPRAVCAEVIWMLSEIGGDKCVEPLAALLTHEELREDARMGLQRIEGARSLAALQAALETAPDDFKLNLAQSLRQRGVTVEGLPCQKLTPVKPTQVKPVGR